MATSVLDISTSAPTITYAFWTNCFAIMISHYCIDTALRLRCVVAGEEVLDERKVAFALFDERHVARHLKDLPANVGYRVEERLDGGRRGLVESTRNQQGGRHNAVHSIDHAPVLQGSNTKELVGPVHRVVHRGVLIEHLGSACDLWWIRNNTTDVLVVVDLRSRQILRVVGRAVGFMAIQRGFDLGWQLAAQDLGLTGPQRHGSG